MLKILTFLSRLSLRWPPILATVWLSVTLMVMGK